jgi:protein associated with RNAse G/E
VMPEQDREELEIEVRVLKYDGTVHRRWRALRALREDSLLVLDAVFEEEVRHSQLGVIRRGTVSIEYYWLDRWYNVFRFLEPDGSVRNFYCNVNMPPRFDGRTLSYVDLDMDIVVSPALSYEILDMDEFWINAERYKYPLEVQNRARGALYELISLIEAREFPFNQNA